MNIIKKQIIRIKRKRLLKIIKKAKELYILGYKDYMCNCFAAAHKEWYCYEEIVKNIPEFKPSTFYLDCDCHGAWWSYKDKESKIEAFDKLIEIYSE